MLVRSLATASLFAFALMAQPPVAAPKPAAPKPAAPKPAVTPAKPAVAAAKPAAPPREPGLYATLNISHGTVPLGRIVFKLYEKESPVTVKNFVDLAQGRKEWLNPKTGTRVKAPLFNGLTFHRVIADFMIQGGDPQGNGMGGTDAIVDEFHPSLKFDRPGRVAMANAGPGTGSSQFFITEGTPNYLNGRHTIFGQVVEGQELVSKIARLPKGPGDKPVTPVRMTSVVITRVADPAAAKPPVVSQVKPPVVTPAKPAVAPAKPAPTPAREPGLYATLNITHGTESLGRIVFKFYEKESPVTVKNFVDLAQGRKEWLNPKTRTRVKAPLFNGLTFHRVIADFMIQGGDPQGNGMGGTDAIIDEFHPSLKFDVPGRVAMANAGPGTGSSQFFITEGTPSHLTGRHTIFGQVVEGQELVAKIARLPKGPGDKPVTPVRMSTVVINRVADPNAPKPPAPAVKKAVTPAKPVAAAPKPAAPKPAAAK